MNAENKGKKAPWRWIVGLLSILYILFLWLKKGVLSVYTTMPQEQILPLAVTTIAVSLIKVVALAGMVLLVKWFLGKMKK